MMNVSMNLMTKLSKMKMKTMTIDAFFDIVPVFFLIVLLGFQLMLMAVILFLWTESVLHFNEFQNSYQF